MDRTIRLHSLLQTAVFLLAIVLVPTMAFSASKAATPVFSPAAGTYSGAQSVTITDGTSGATIYYTTDGTTPTTSSARYSGAITVSSSETLEAIATATGYSQSTVGIATYTITLPQAATPAFSPGAGSYTTSQNVTITDGTSGATIYYTTNGTTPTTSSTAYTGAILVSSTQTLKAIAAAAGYSQSAVAAATYTLTLPAATPAFSPAPGGYTTSQTVTITDGTSGATIYYTTDGTTPTTSSSTFRRAITVSSNETLKAIATASGYTQSAVATGTYTIEPQTATPTFSLGGGTYTGSQTVSITDGTSGAIIYYTTDGTTPTTSSSVYSSSVTISSSETLEAMATAANHLQSAVNTAAYRILPQIISLSPSSGPGGTSIAITGSAFGDSQGTSSVTVGGLSVIPIGWSATQINAQIPNGIGTGNQNVVVIVAGSSAVAHFTVTPVITGISPTSGLPGTYVKIVGTNFGSTQGSSSVTFNSVGAQITKWTTTSIQAIAPLGSNGPVVVNVYNPSNYSTTSSNGVLFTAPSGPTITGLGPVMGPVGTSVTISGFNFGSSGTVTFNGVSASPTTWGSQTIIVPVPAGATTGSVAVTVDGATSNNYPFTVSASITGIAPTQGNVGTIVTITGSGFGASQGSGSVTFNGVLATPSNWSNTSIAVTVPSAATSGSLAVVVNGASTIGPAFVVLPSPPSITSLSPTDGPLGMLVTVVGSNFGSTQGTSSVGFGQVPSVPTQWSQNRIVVPVPLTAVTGPVVVAVQGQASNALLFTVDTTSAASITGTVTQSDGVTPIVGAAIAVLNGSGTVATTATNASGAYSVPNLSADTYSLQVSAFQFSSGKQSGVVLSAGQAAVVNFNLIASMQPTITYTYDEIGRLVGVTDPIKGTASYSYDAVGNILSVSRATSGQVSILDFTPKTGPIGTSVTISGTSFSTIAQQNTVTFGGISASVNSATSSQLVVTVPAGATTGPITVTTPSGASTSSATFTITTITGGPTITSFDPAMANVGGAVVIEGSGFDSLVNDHVEFNAARAYITSATPTSMSTTVPANASSGPITVTTPTGSAISNADFFVIPTAYTPSQIDFTGHLVIGQPFTGTIKVGGDIGILLFNGILGSGFDLQISGSTIASANISILNPDGSVLTQSSIGSGDSVLETPPLSATKTYTIIVTGASTGSLTLSLSQTVQSPIVPGVAQTVTINTAGQNAQLIFHGTKGQLASVQLSNFAFPATYGVLQVSILKPDGTTLVSTVMYQTAYPGTVLYQNPVALPETGTYTLLIAPQGGSTGSTNVAVYLFSEQVSTIMPGSAATVTLNVPGQNVQLSFFGNAGQLASVQLSNFAFPATYSVLQVSILKPDGTTLVSTAMYQTAYPGTVLYQNPVALPETGTYTLLIAPQGGSTGSTNVAVYLFSEQVSTIMPGSAATVTVNVPGQNVQLSFFGNAGQLASVQLSNFAFPATYGVLQVSILKPDGTTLVSTAMYQTIYPGTVLYQSPVTLPETGTYTLLIAPQGGSTGSTNVAVYLFNDQIAAIIPGTPTTITMNIPGQNLRMSFSGNEGQLASVQLSNFAFPATYGVLQVSILKPDGTTLVSTAMYQTIYPGTVLYQSPVALPEAGIYTLLIAPQGGSTGSTTVALTLQ